MGLILRLAYRLRRHEVVGWSAARIVGILLFLLGVWAMFAWWPSPWPAAVAGAVLLARWPSYEVGWWYIFFRPEMIREMAVGYLYVGRGRDLALRVVHGPDEKTQEAVYLAFADRVGLRRVWDDLLLDAPPEPGPETVP